MVISLKRFVQNWTTKDSGWPREIILILCFTSPISVSETLHFSIPTPIASLDMHISNLSQLLTTFSVIFFQLWLISPPLPPCHWPPRRRLFVQPAPWRRSWWRWPSGAWRASRSCCSFRRTPRSWRTEGLDDVCNMGKYSYSTVTAMNWKLHCLIMGFMTTN